MKKVALSLFVIPVLLAPIFAYAAGVFSAPTNLDKVWYDGTQKRLVLEAKTVYDRRGCGKSSYYEIQDNGNDIDRIEKIALAALLAGRQVIIQVSDKDCGVYGQPVANGVQLTK